MGKGLALGQQEQGTMQTWEGKDDGKVCSPDEWGKPPVASVQKREHQTCNSQQARVRISLQSQVRDRLPIAQYILEPGLTLLQQDLFSCNGVYSTLLARQNKTGRCIR